MLGKLALSRTNWAALAVLAAVVAAMFVALSSLSAQTASLTISIGDSDNIVKAPSSHPITLTVKDGTQSTVSYITATAGVVVTGTPALTGTTLVVPSSASGEYTISARVTDGTTPVEGELTVTVGDPGQGVGSAEVVLASVDTSADPVTHTVEGTEAANRGTDTATAAVDSPIRLSVKVLNSLGNKANDGDVHQVILFAPGANVGVANDSASVNSVQTADAASSTQSTNFSVRRTAAQGTGTIHVHAVVIGPSGTATSEPLALTFTGDPATVSLGEASGPLATSGQFAFSEDTDAGTAGVQAQAAENVVTVNVTAADASGNTAMLMIIEPTYDATNDATTASTGIATGVAVAVLDADDKPATGIVSRFKTNNKVQQVELHGSSTAKPGMYTLQLTFLGKKYTADLVVSGSAAGIDLSSSHETVGLGDIITVTATVTDKDGSAVADKTSVEFNAVGALKLNALGKGAEGGNVNSDTDDGVATARFVVIDGSGTATIIASIGGVDGVTSVATEAEEPEAMPEEEASVSCLSNLSGFSTWSCGVESSAVEIFGLVSGRGASAVHLWNGSEWVRYSVVEGAMVPGSSDFMVTEDDILYISN